MDNLLPGRILAKAADKLPVIECLGKNCIDESILELPGMCFR
ncbi:MAG TPA: hypothetical protein VFO37_00950 [Chitinophagaceae bacterium]|nr:hypothetical protein [Chitinophagaceae bacterium]